MTDRERQLFLLRRFGFGASYEDQKLLQPSWTRLLEVLLAEPKDPDAFVPYPFLKRDNGEAATRIQGMRDWWLAEMVCSPHVLRERMTIFWHDHFAVDLRNLSPQALMIQHVIALRKDPLGRFEDLLKGMTRDPAFMKF